MKSLISIIALVVMSLAPTASTLHAQTFASIELEGSLQVYKNKAGTIMAVSNFNGQYIYAASDSILAVCSDARTSAYLPYRVPEQFRDCLQIDVNDYNDANGSAYPTAIDLLGDVDATIFASMTGAGGTSDASAANQTAANDLLQDILDEQTQAQIEADSINAAVSDLNAPVQVSHISVPAGSHTHPMTDQRIYQVQGISSDRGYVFVLDGTSVIAAWEVDGSYYKVWPGGYLSTGDITIEIRDEPTDTAPSTTLTILLSNIEFK